MDVNVRIHTDVRLGDVSVT